MRFLPFVLLSISGICVRLTSAAGCGPTILFPAPSGPFQVDVNEMELVDSSRTQPFAPSVQPRKLMVSLFHPVQTTCGTVPASYMPPYTALTEDNELSSLYGVPVPNGTFEKLALQVAGKSSTGHPGPRQPTFPVVLFMPAEATTRLFYSVIAQTIASSGYIVVTIDTPYDVDVVQYTDGSVAYLNQTAVDNVAPSNFELAIDTRAQDASFILDQLTNTTIVSQLIPGATRGLNVSKVAMFGHSLGGAAAAAAMLNDSRIAGGVSMDGALGGPVVQKGLDRPFMFIAHTGHIRSNDSSPADPPNSWFDIWPRLRAFKLDIMLANSLHYTFSDFPIVFETLGIIPDHAGAEAVQITNMDGKRALKIVATYVTAFLDFVLLGKKSTLLDKPVPEFPEVTFDR